jgi:hypothetical protein
MRAEERGAVKGRSLYCTLSREIAYESVPYFDVKEWQVNAAQKSLLCLSAIEEVRAQEEASALQSV